MRILLIIFILSLSMLNSFGQNKMVVNQIYNGNTFYGEHSKHIKSSTELPTVIQFNLHGYLNKILGKISDSLTFSHGQIIDVENYFKTDSITFNYGWVVPNYDLNFLIADESLGIYKYYLQVRLDKYGQILYSNWPKERHADRKEFKNNSDIEKYAIKHANYKGFDTTDYKVEFKYNKKHDKLCWVFMFRTKDSDIEEYNTIEIPWNYIEIIEEYFSTITSSH